MSEEDEIDAAFYEAAAKRPVTRTPCTVVGTVERSIPVLEDKPFGREDLQEIRAWAEGVAKVVGLNSTWARAYLALADAADRLDAMLARCTVHEEAPKE